MPDTARTLNNTIRLLNEFGLWTGQHFAHGRRLTISAAAYLAVTGTIPDAFYTDDDQALALITANDQVMEAIAYLSACLDTQPNLTDEGGLDYIEHVEGYASNPAIGDTNPPPANEVIGRILRAARVAATLAGAVPDTRPAA